MQLLRFPINLFPYKQLQFTWIEWINCIEVFSSLTNSLLECSSWRLLANSWAQRMANSLAQTLDNPKEGASLVVTLQETPWPKLLTTLKRVQVWSSPCKKILLRCRKLVLPCRKFVLPCRKFVWPLYRSIKTESEMIGRSFWLLLTAPCSN